MLKVTSEKNITIWGTLVYTSETIRRKSNFNFRRFCQLVQVFLKVKGMYVYRMQYEEINLFHEIISCT
jgi:hypothetical protein